jgi:transposase-like protein
MEENIPEGFTVFMLPPYQRKSLRSTNMVERINREIKIRTRVATLFPNECHPCSAWQDLSQWKQARNGNRLVKFI